MTQGNAPLRPRPITMSALICSIVSLLVIATVGQAVGYGVAVGNAGFAALAVGGIGLLCAFLLFTLNQFARLSFVVFWLTLVSAACYSLMFLRSTRDYRGVLGITFLVACGIVLWNAINRNWPRSGARSNNSLERTRER